MAATAASLAFAAAAGPASRPVPAGTIVFERFGVNPVGYAVFTVRADGTQLRRLTLGPARVDSVEPELSPDGRWIVFQRGPHNGDTEIYRMRRDGSGVRRLTACPSCHWSGDPSWSPDARSIVFTRWDAAGRVAIWKMGADGSRPGLLVRPRGRAPRDQPSFYPTVPAPTGAFADQPALSPDGRRLAYRGTTAAGQVAVWVADADGTDARPVTPPRLRASRPRWSPDGRLLVFYTTDKDDLQPGVSANLAVVRPDGSGFHWLTRDRGGGTQSYEASWSPDGRWLTFTRESGANEPPGQHANGDIYVMRADGTDVRRLVGTMDSDAWPVWGR
jgi:Tol biopolymer transport system component